MKKQTKVTDTKKTVKVPAHIKNRFDKAAEQINKALKGK